MIDTTTHTYREILQQPSLWLKVFGIINKEKQGISDFLNTAMINNDVEVIMTGAGSSFFIGEIVAPFFQRDTGCSTRAIETTEIVSHPKEHINPFRSTLLISFARSGNSPESVAAIENANKASSKINHLIITCNKDGALSKIKGDNVYSILLPEKANDKSLAMTSSVSSMALMALLIGRLDKLNEMKMEVQVASELFKSNMPYLDTQFERISSIAYSRAVFLGSGPMKGVAHESHLKLQELTDGEIICKFDSFLGFRHGPKAVVNDDTMMVYTFSNNKYVRQYEIDLVKGVEQGQSPKLTIGISNKAIEGLNFDLNIVLDGVVLDDAIWTIASLLPSQLLAFHKSVSLGYDPDSPSKSGAIHRVVQGVNIYNISEIQFNNNNNGQKS